MSEINGQTGRTRSQISIYNYPEKNNPFYEDDQHKRLRFWKITTSKKDGSRRGSFNLGSFKDFLPLKSFRLKKRSSALGINKTSESPPPLRKQIESYNVEDGDKYATYDPHFRNTVSVGLNSNFHRNVPYRSSLQDMNRNGDLDFNRNNRYRSTFQSGTLNQVSPLRDNNARYVYSGSITPTPRTRYLTNMGMTPGSSMNSISTNPFDDDDDNADSVTISSTMSKSPHKRARKKRRAPPPPMITKPITETEAISLRIEENGDSVKSNGLEELSRLTADFESFVSSQDDIDIDKRPKTCTTITETVEVHQQNEINRIDVKATQRDEIHNEIKIHESSTYEKESQQKTKIEPQVIELKIQETKEKSPEPVIDEIHQDVTEVRQFPEVKKITPTPTPSREETPDYIPIPVREKFHVLRIDETELNTKSAEIDERVIQSDNRKSLSPEENSVYIIEKTPVVIETKIINKPKEPSPTLKEPSPTFEEPIHEKLDPNEVKMKFMKDPSPIPRKREETPIPIARTEVEEKLTSQGFIKVTKSTTFDEPEENFIRKKEPQPDEEIDPNSPPKPPERRRSVKDIIESINRNQALLKINQPATPKFERKFSYGSQKFSYHEKPAPPNKENVMRKLQIQAESEKRINEMLADLEDFRNDNPSVGRVQQFPNISDDQVTFEKCTVRSDRNNNATDDDLTERISRGDINPVPKPRRFFENTSDSI